MATTGIHQGDDFRLYFAGLPVGYSTSCTLDISTETRETIHKDNPGTGFVDVTLGKISGSGSVEAYANEDAASAYTASATKTLTDYSLNKTLLTGVLKGGAMGDMKLTFNLYIIGASISAPAGDDTTASFSFVTTGTITSTTVT